MHTPRYLVANHSSRREHRPKSLADSYLIAGRGRTLAALSSGQVFEYREVDDPAPHQVEFIGSYQVETLAIVTV